MKQYEALFIFHNPTQEDGIKHAVDKVTKSIEGTGGKVETVQKMDRKAFTRVTDKKVTSGFYANVIFRAPSGSLEGLKNQLSGQEEVHRLMITLAPAVQAPQPLPTGDADAA